MSKQHTPGPWRYTADEDGDNFRLYAGGEQIVGGCGCCGSPWVIGVANARLIAAAPELLEALKAMVAFSVEMHDFRERALVNYSAIDIARAAIAKAGGNDE